MRQSLYILLINVFISALYAQAIYGIKSRSDNTGGAGEYLTPATLFSFQDTGSQFTAINPITKNSVQIRADGLAYSSTQGLWCFEPTSGTVSALYQLNPATAAVISSGIVYNNRQIFGAAFDRHDNLWAIDETQDELLKIDITTGAILRAVPLTKNGSSFNLEYAHGDIVFNSLGKAYLVFSCGLYSLNTYTGVLTDVYQDITPYSKILVGAAIPTSRPDTLFGFEVSMSSIDNDDVFIYNLANLAQPAYLYNSILTSYNAGCGDLATDVPADLVVGSTFDSDADGWTGAALSTANISQVVQTLSISYDNGGFIGVTDNDNEWTTFAAPQKYLGDKSNWLGGEISLDMLHTTSETRTHGPMVFLVGNDTVLCSPWTIPSDSWQHFAIPLRPAGWHLNTYDGPQPTLAQMLAVLSNLQAMYIIGDYVAGVETTWIDNVRMTSGLSPDLSGNGFVNYEDFALFASYWQQSGCTAPDWCQGANINQDGSVDFDDLEYVIVRWLQETQ